MALKTRRPTVCLVMIVRNEAAVIERCLASARPWIDTWVICDTGSTDGTQDVIRSALADLPGTLHERPWQNFGHNRNEALQLASSHADYLLLLDADMTVDGDPGALSDLDADAYLVPVLGDPEYWMPYLVRAALPWRYEGATHEYLTTKGPYRRVRLQGLRLHHHADGGSRHDKFTRDRDLLSQALEQDPNDSRAVFYLAQTYRDLGDTPKALELYRRRAAMGGWDEEVFYSLYQTGVLLAQHDWPSAVNALIAAWNARPTRAEPLYELAAGFRQRGQYAAAHLFCTRGMAIAPPDDILFVSGWVYRWGLAFEYSVSAYWVGEFEAARDACLKLAARADLPEPWRTHNARNLAFCEAELQAKSRG